MELKNDKNVLGLLYLISKSEGGFSQRIRLQKMVLLAKYEFHFEFSYSYLSYYYGPYSRDLQNTISNLVDEEILEEEIIQLPFSDNVTYNYKITTKGTGLILNLKQEIRFPIDELWKKYSNSSTDYIIKSAKEKSHIKSLNER